MLLRFKENAILVDQLMADGSGHRLHPSSPSLAVCEPAGSVARWSRYMKWQSWCQTLLFALCTFGGFYQVWCHGLNAHGAGDREVCLWSASPMEQTCSGRVMWWEPELCAWVQRGDSRWNRPPDRNGEGDTSFLCQIDDTGALQPVMFVCTSPWVTFPWVRRSLRTGAAPGCPYNGTKAICGLVYLCHLFGNIND